MPAHQIFSFRPVKIMARRTRIKDPREPRAQRLRRSQNATLNASAWARLRQRGRVAPHEADQTYDSEMMENPYDPNEESQFHGEESKSTGQQEEYPRWLTMPTAEELEEHIDPSIHSVQEEYRRQAREFNWALLMRELHTWYLILKLHTKNWSSANACEEQLPPLPCTCSAEQKNTRHVDMIDLYAQTWRPIEFCKCTYDAVHLLRHGYLAGSPLKPQTAFSLPLLIFHNSLWNNCNIGMSPFTIALTKFLEPRSERLCVKGKSHMT